MSYEVFARKLRPKGFEALVGQEHVVKALTHALDNDRLHHAYLFTGTRGVGKTTVARILARCLNCETNGVSAVPCGTCSACQAIDAGRFVDLIEVDAASRTGVADTRELLDNAQYMPTQGRYKVFLIDEVHMLSNAAFNALLKTLEEPPPHVVFVLATTEAKKVPVTVLSRCLQFQLKNIPAERISAYLAEVLSAEDIGFETDALEAIARSARGSMRDALSITDQAIAFGQGTLSAAAVAEMLGAVGRNEVDGLLAALATQDGERLMALTGELADRAVDFSGLLEAMMAALHERAVRSALAGNVEVDGLSAEALHLYYQMALMGFRDLQIAPDARVGMEMTLLRMLAFAPDANSAVPRGGGTGGDAPDDGASEPQPDAATPAEAGMQTGAPPPAGAPVATAASAIEPEAKLPLPEPLASWYAWTAQAPVQGVARMLLEHSVLEVETGDLLKLRLDPRHDTLLNDAQVASMGRALSEVVGRTVTVTVSTGHSPYETPAERGVRQLAERQAEAERAIEEDATVQALLREFGGTVTRVQPLDG